MNSNIPFPSMALDAGWLRFLLPLFVLALCGNAWGACPATPPYPYQDIDITCPVTQGGATYASTGPSAIIGPIIELCPPPPATTTNVKWKLGGGVNCSHIPLTSPDITCSTMKITAPAPPDMPVPVTSTVTISGTTPSGLSDPAIFTVTVTDAAISSVTCDRTYTFHVTASGDGWGDPHITTVDGVHYDFQSAGELTALRGDGLEIQTRQTPVATTYLPGASHYTGLPTCVALYSAVAARVGTHRVSYQPNISGVPDPTGLQLRVDGVLTTLGPDGIDLGSGGPIVESPAGGHIVKPPVGGRIVKSPVGGGIEIHYSDGTQLVVTPAYWHDQQKWYLNVNVYGTTATEGIFGKLAKDSWLPALPDGTSLGPQPESLHQRYVDLYEKFADAWRVTDATSLFDYKPGTSTATFTLGEWPRENPQSCAIPEQPSAQPVDIGVAKKLCSKIVDDNNRANCEFDVSVTGEPGFAQTYETSEQLQPDATETTVKDDEDPTKYGESVTFTATVAQKVSRGGGAPTGTVQFILDGGNVGNPVTLDANGRALWSTSSLQVGQHQIVAKYAPTGWGGLFVASSSPEKSHSVIAAHDLYFWLVILLIIIILIVLIIWRYLRTQ